MTRIPVRVRVTLAEPPIDDLLDRVESRYALVLIAARRARQITAYDGQRGWPSDAPGPVVARRTSTEKPLSIALRELHTGKLKVEPDGEVAS